MSTISRVAKTASKAAKKAKKQLDMSEAARMARAKEQGFDIDNLFTHRGGQIDEIRNDGLFGGIFVSPGSTSRHGFSGDIETTFITKRGVAGRGDYDLDYDAALKTIKDEFPGESDEFYDKMYRWAAEDKSDPWDDNILASRGFDEGEASWEAQRVRGRIAADQGFDAIAMDDEHGTSYLLPAGTQAKPITATFDPEDITSSNLLAQYAPLAVGAGAAGLALSPEESMAAGMNVYEVEDPVTGMVLELEGDSPPTEQELEEIFAQYAPTTVEESRLEIDVPLPPEDVEQLTPEQQKQYFGTVDPQEFTAKEWGLGGLQALGTLVTAPTTGMAGQFVGGTAQAAKDIASGEFGSYEAAQRVGQAGERGAESMTYIPSSPAGIEVLETVGDVLGPIGAAAGALSPMAASGLGTMARASMPQVKAGIPNIPRFERQKISDVRAALKDNTTQSVGWKLQGDKVKPNMLERDLLDAGVKDTTITGLRRLGQRDQRSALQMLDIAEDIAKGKESADLSRFSTVAGDRVMERFKFLADKQDEAASKITRAVQKDLRGKPVDVGDIQDSLVIGIRNNGADIVDGRVRLSDLSAFQPTDAKLLSEAYRALGKDFDNAADLHRLKRTLSDRLYGTASGAAPQRLSEKAEGILKGVRGQINEKLRALSDDYRAANDDYAKAASALKPFEDLMGNKYFDPESADVGKFTGVQLRTILSNYQKGTEVAGAVENLTNIANDFGGKFGNEVVGLVKLNSDLEGLLGTPATQSLKGVGQQIAEEGARRGAGGMADIAMKAGEAAKRRTSLWDAPVSERLDLINKLREQVKSQ